MNRDEYQAGLIQAYTLGQLLLGLPLAEMSKAISRADSLGPILDPTLWRDKHKKMDQDAAVVRALLTCQNALEAAGLAPILPAAAAESTEAPDSASPENQESP